MSTYITHNYAMVTTAQPTPVTTGTAIKTMLQIGTPAGQDLEVVAWGFSFDGVTASAQPVSVELIETGAIAATVTAHVAAGVQPFRDPNCPASSMTLSTTATGYTASAEGTIVASRTFDEVQAPPTQPYAMWFPLGDRPKVAISRFLRVRVKAAAAVNMTCWIVWEE